MGANTDEGDIFLSSLSWPELVPELCAAISRGYMRLERWEEAERVCAVWERAEGPPVSTDVFNALIRTAAKGRHLPTVLRLLDVLTDTGATADDVTFELVGNAAVRDVSFVTSAVSLETTPKASIPEVCFIGRSNVGKSSLVNMVCNRRALAYASKTPGKTQQFNYFAVNKESRWKPQGAFYIVDLPGVGYAKVPKPLRQSWLAFMKR